MQFSAVSKVLVYQRKSCALYKMRETSYYCYEIQQPKSRLCKSKTLFKTNCCIVHVLSMQKSIGLVLLCDRVTTMWIDVDIHYARHAKHDCSVRFTAFQKCITWPPVMRDMSSIAWQQDDLGFPKYAVFDTTAMCPAKKSACLLEFKDMVSIFGKYYIYANTVTSLVSCLNRRKSYVTDIPRTELRREEKVHLWN